MREYQDKKRRRKIIYSGPVLTGLLVVLVFLLISLWGIFQKSREALRLKNESLEEKRELDSRSASLKEEVDRLASDAGKEEAIRKRFSVKKPGEEVLVIIQNDKKEEGDGDTEAGFFNKIWQGVRNFFITE